MSATFNKLAFEALFLGALERLAASEKVSKETLRDLSRDLLEATHATGDVGYLNRLLPILSPMNKKTAIVFFKHFAGFSFDETSRVFTKKSKKRYDAAHAATVEFLADPHNNIWTWAERHIEVQVKPFTFDSLADGVKHIMDKAQKAGLSQSDVVRAAIKNGLTVDTLLAVIGEVGGYEIKVDGETPQAAQTVADKVGEALM